MPKTTVVHCRDPHDIYIGRPSVWGNPFKLGRDGTRDDVISKYQEWILRHPQLLDRLRELKGKRLGCWCKPEACHGDVLVELADSLPDLGLGSILDGFNDE